MKRYSISLATKEMQIQITRYYFLPTRIVRIKKPDNNSIGENMKKSKLSYTAGLM